MEKIGFIEEIYDNISLNERFQFYMTPHGDQILISFSGNANNLQIFSNSSENISFIKDEVRISALLNLLKSCHEGVLYNVQTLYDNSGNLNIFVNLQIETESIPTFALFQSVSHDYGKSWSDPKQLTSEFDSWIINHPAIILKNGIHLGDILLPVEDVNSKRAMVLHSDDNGKNWNLSLYLEAPESFNQEDAGVEDPIFYETAVPAIFESITGNIVCLFYSVVSKKTCVVESKDRGYTWINHKYISFDLCGQYPIFSYKCGFIDDHLPKNTLFLGIVSDLNDNKLRIIECEENFEKTAPLWETHINSNFDSLYYTIYCDFDQNIHILYLVNEDSLKLHHIRFNCLDLKF